MASKVELTPLAEKGLDKLDPQIARRILSLLHGRLAQMDDPPAVRKAAQKDAL